MESVIDITTGVNNTFHMTNRAIWLLSATCLLAGFCLLYQGPSSGALGHWSSALGTLLIVMPVGMATGITARRRRHERREDDPSSLEYQAARVAGSKSYVDCLLMGLLLVIALAAFPGAFPAQWAVLFVVLAVLSYWMRYILALRGLRG